MTSLRRRTARQRHALLGLVLVLLAPGCDTSRRDQPLRLVGLALHPMSYPHGIYVYWAWSPHQGWRPVRRPPRDPHAPGWLVSDWQYFEYPPLPETQPTLKTNPVILSWMDDSPVYEERSLTPEGALAVSNAQNLEPRPYRMVINYDHDLDTGQSRKEITQGTQAVLRRAGVTVPWKPYIREAYAADLDGDGKKELVWVSDVTVRGMAIHEPDEYALVAMKKRGRTVPLSLVTARLPGPFDQGITVYHLEPPVDVDGDGIMEVFVVASLGGTLSSLSKLLLYRLERG